MDKNDLVRKLFTNIDALGRAASAQKFAPTAKGMPTNAQVGVLFVIFHSGPQSIKDIAAKFGMTPSGITQLVNGLVRDGLLTRTEDAQDRRKICVTLTGKGRESMAAIKKQRYETLSKVFEPLSSNELIQLDTILQKLVKQVQTIWTKNQNK